MPEFESGTTTTQKDPPLSSRPASERPAARRPGAAPRRPEAGDTIKHYELIRELGEGGMGVVFLARDTKLGRRVALKLVTKLSGADARSFLVEARTTARLSHPNIPVIHEVDEHRGHPYMVLEYIEGQSLRDWMKARHEEARRISPDAPMPPVPPSQAVEIILPVVRALEEAHSRGIVHRDLKPDNIMRGALGAIKLVDFGIAKVPAGIGDAIPTEDLERFASIGLPALDGGANRGTPLYMSPEQFFRKEDVDARADLWAVGVILYELLAGAHPLPSASLVTLVHNAAMLDAPMPQIAHALPDLGDLAAIVDHCLEKRKERRMPSAKELREALEAYQGARLRPDKEGNPFTGLAPFQVADAPRFFGRERDLAIALKKLERHALLPIAGPSGAGKSSFVRASLIPALKRSGENWRELILRPGRHPLAALAELCAHIAGGPALEEPQSTAARLRAEPGYLGSLLRASCRKDEGRVLLFVDQFEELYTLGAAKDERAAFTACLTGAADDESSPVRVVLSIRSDFIDRTGEDPNLALRMTLGLSRLLPMDRETLKAALTRPVTAAGHRFESEEMVTRMLDELMRPGSPLPLLQFTAAKLWEDRDRPRRLLTLSSYEKLGGVKGALSTHADAVFAGLAPHDQRLCREICLRLCTHESPRIRRVVSLSELRELAEDHAAVEQVVRHLADARLLLLEKSEREDTTVELVHESLIEGWAKLGEWLDESKQDAQFLGRVRVAAREWAASGEPEGLLWRDRAAEEAEAWLERRQDKPTADAHARLGRREEQYLLAVVALARRARRLRRWAAASALATLSVIVLMVALLAVREKQEAARARDESIRLLRAQETTVHAAEFAAHRVAELTAWHFDRYRAAVEAAGQDPQVAQALAAPESTKASEVCSRFFSDHKGPTAGPFSEWFLLDTSGKLIGREPAAAYATLGRGFEFRDYFRGAVALAKQGQRRAYVSPAYKSEASDDHEFAISFPVHDAADRWVGILAAAIPTGSALGSLEFPGAESDGLNVALISPRGRDRHGEPDPSPIFVLHRALGRGKTRPINPADVLGSGFVSRVPVRDTPFVAFVSVASDLPLAATAPQLTP